MGRRRWSACKLMTLGCFFKGEVVKSSCLYSTARQLFAPAHSSHCENVVFTLIVCGPQVQKVAPFTVGCPACHLLMYMSMFNPDIHVQMCGMSANVLARRSRSGTFHSGLPHLLFSDSG